MTQREIQQLQLRLARLEQQDQEERRSVEDEVVEEGIGTSPGQGDHNDDSHRWTNPSMCKRENEGH